MDNNPNPLVVEEVFGMNRIIMDRGLKDDDLTPEILQEIREEWRAAYADMQRRKEEARAELEEINRNRILQGHTSHLAIVDEVTNPLALVEMADEVDILAARDARKKHQEDLAKLREEFDPEKHKTFPNRAARRAFMKQQKR